MIRAFIADAIGFAFLMIFAASLPFMGEIARAVL